MHDDVGRQRRRAEALKRCERRGLAGGDAAGQSNEWDARVAQTIKPAA
jgi:hypothetical protein